MSDPFIGAWELDPSTLNYESGVPGKRAIYAIVATPNGLLFLLDGEDGEGKPIKFQYGGPTDGSGRPLPGGSGLVLVLKRDGERIIESVLKREEIVLDRWTRELSADGQTMTITQYVPNLNGREFQNTSLYRRVTD